MHRISKAHFATILSVILATPATAERVEGDYDLKLMTFYGLTQTGDWSQEGTDFCGRVVGKVWRTGITGTYDIDTETLIEKVTATYNSQTIDLSALGMDDRYAFMSTELPPEIEKLGIFRINYEMDLSFENKAASIFMDGNDEFNCVVSNVNIGPLLEGEFTIKLDRVIGETRDGKRTPEAQEYCKPVAVEFMGRRFTVKYELHTDTQRYFAWLKYLGAEFELWPTGLVGTYSFLSKELPEEMTKRNVGKIFATLEYDLAHKTANVVVDSGGPFVCSVTNVDI